MACLSFSSTRPAGTAGGRPSGGRGDTECAIKAMSASPDARTIIVGGQDMLKLVRVEADSSELGAQLVEWKTVRESRKKKKNLNYSVQDLAWHPTHPHKVASGSTNGAVLLWYTDRVGQSGKTSLVAETVISLHLASGWLPWLTKRTSPSYS